MSAPTSGPALPWETLIPSTQPPVVQPPVFNRDKSLNDQQYTGIGLISGSIATFLALLIWLGFRGKLHPIAKITIESILAVMLIVGVGLVSNNNLLDKNHYMQGGLAILLAGLTGLAISYIYIVNFNRVTYEKNFNAWVAIGIFILLAIIVGSVMIGVESGASSYEELDTAHKWESLVFSICLLIAGFVGIYTIYQFKFDTTYFFILLLTTIGAVGGATIWLGLVSADIVDSEEKAMFGAGIVILIYGLFLGALAIYRFNVSLTESLNEIGISTAIAVTGIALAIAGGVAKPDRDGQFIPLPTDPVYPQGLTCKFISRTITKNINWATENNVTMRFTALLGLLPNDGTVYQTTKLMELKDEDDQTLWNVTFLDTQNLQLQYFNEEGSPVSTVTIPIEPVNNRFTANISISSFEDVQKHLGTIVIRNDETGTNARQDSKFIDNIFSPSRWGKNTVLEVFTNQNSPLLEGIQLCQESDKIALGDLPVGYQVVFFLFIALLIIIAIFAVSNSKFSKAMFGIEGGDVFRRIGTSIN